MSGSSIDPRSILLATSLQQDLVLLIPTLWAWLFCHSSVHLCSSINSFSMMILQEAVSKALLKSRQIYFYFLAKCKDLCQSTVTYHVSLEGKSFCAKLRFEVWERTDFGLCHASGGRLCYWSVGFLKQSQLSSFLLKFSFFPILNWFTTTVLYKWRD